MEDELQHVSPGFSADAIAAFWQIARESVGWTALQPIIGVSRASSVMPPFVKLADDPQAATDMAKEVAAGTRTEMRTPL